MERHQTVKDHCNCQGPAGGIGVKFSKWRISRILIEDDGLPTPARSAVMQRTSKRVGFTLIELIVVVAIIVALMALILPAAMRSARGGVADELHNNLHNIGLAFEGYLNDYKTYPTGGGDLFYPADLTADNDAPYSLIRPMRASSRTSRQALDGTARSRRPAFRTAGSTRIGVGPIKSFLTWSSATSGASPTPWTT